MSEGVYGMPPSGIMAIGHPPKPLITMYVRRGESSDPKVRTRVISLNPIPTKASMDDLLKIGFGFDGDSVTVEVTKDTLAEPAEEGKLPHIGIVDDLVKNAYDVPLSAWTLASALNNVQTVLVDWLRSLGYEVKIS